MLCLLEMINHWDISSSSHQEQVYSATTRGLVRDVISGYNATVFAYGATGAGKTHTMVGSDQEPGIMVRALNDIFRSIDKHGQNYTVSEPSNKKSFLKSVLLNGINNWEIPRSMATCTRHLLLDTFRETSKVMRFTVYDSKLSLL